MTAAPDRRRQLATTAVRLGIGSCAVAFVAFQLGIWLDGRWYPTAWSIVLIGGLLTLAFAFAADLTL